MVGARRSLAVVLGLAAGPGLAESPMEAMFPGKTGCYARSYDDSHLARHTEQLVTDMALAPEGSIADPMLGLWVMAELRGDIAGQYEGLAYCENTGASLSCGMEGDAGWFTITPDTGGKILVEIGRHGLSFEGEAGFITLKSDRGDDRSFLLAPAPCG